MARRAAILGTLAALGSADAGADREGGAAAVGGRTLPTNSTSTFSGGLPVALAKGLEIPFMSRFAPSRRTMRRALDEAAARTPLTVGVLATGSMAAVPAALAGTAAQIPLVGGAISNALMVAGMPIAMGAGFAAGLAAMALQPAASNMTLSHGGESPGQCVASQLRELVAGNDALSLYKCLCFGDPCPAFEAPAEKTQLIVRELLSCAAVDEAYAAVIRNAAAQIDDAGAEDFLKGLAKDIDLAVELDHAAKAAAEKAKSRTEFLEGFWAALHVAGEDSWGPVYAVLTILLSSPAAVLIAYSMLKAYVELGRLKQIAGEVTKAAEVEEQIAAMKLSVMVGLTTLLPQIRDAVELRKQATKIRTMSRQSGDAFTVACRSFERLYDKVFYSRDSIHQLLKIISLVQPDSKGRRGALARVCYWRVAAKVFSSASAVSKVPLRIVKAASKMVARATERVPVLDAGTAVSDDLVETSLGAIQCAVGIPLDVVEAMKFRFPSSNPAVDELLELLRQNADLFEESKWTSEIEAIRNDYQTTRFNDGQGIRLFAEKAKAIRAALQDAATEPCTRLILESQLGVLKPVLEGRDSFVRPDEAVAEELMRKATGR